MSSSEILDNGTLSRLRDGDDDVFAELFSQNRERLKRMLRFRMDRRLQARQDASDVLQDVYLDAHRRIKHFLARPERSFYVWLRQLAAQRLVDLHRHHVQAEKRSVRQEIPIQYHDSSASSASMAMQLAARLATPSQMLMHAELVVRIESALETMDPIDREILALRHFEELRNSEVAEVLGLKPAAASNRYVRALSRLGAILESIPGLLDDGDS